MHNILVDQWYIIITKINNIGMKGIIIQIMVIIVLIIPSFSVFYARRFPNQLEVGSIDVVFVVATQENFEQQGIATLKIAKQTANYQSVLSITLLQVHRWNSFYSYGLSVLRQQPSLFEYQLKGRCFDQWKALTIRYLIIIPEYNIFINAYHIDEDYLSAPKIIGRGTIIQYQLSISAVDANNARASIMLRGMTIKNPNDIGDIDLYQFHQLQNDRLIIKITNDYYWNTTQIWRIGVSAIIIDQQKCYSTVRAFFEQRSYYFKHSDFNFNQQTTTTGYYSDTVFWGLKNIRNVYSKITYTISIHNLTTIKVMSTNYAFNYFELELINFYIKPCQDNQYHYVSTLQCLSICPANTYKNLMQCLDCSRSCLTCSVDASNCTSCQNNYYKENSYCLACPSGCLSCSSSFNCTGCVSGFTLINSVCIDSTTLISCPTECLSCSSSFNCTGCVSGFTLINSACIDSTTLISCPTECLSCSSSFNCTGCVSGFTLINSVCIDSTTLISCPTECLSCSSSFNCTGCVSGFTLINSACIDSTTLISCPTECLSCSSSFNCTGCVSGFTLINSACIDSTTLISCPTECLSCSSSFNCTGCVSGFTLINSACIDSTTLISCPTECLSCSSSFNCTGCVSGFTLINSACIDSTTLISCPTECLSCFSSFNCTSCIIGYDLFNFSCIINCSSISYCITCSITSNSLFCSQCQLHYSTNNGQCLPLCGDGFMVFGQQQCDDNNTQNNDGCSSSCKIQTYYSCTNDSPSICSLSQLNIYHSYSMKIQNENSFVSYFNIFPSVQTLSAINWTSILTIVSSNININNIEFISQTGQLKLLASYSQGVNNKPIEMLLNPSNSNLSSISSINQTNFQFILSSSNNLAFHYYSTQQYTLTNTMALANMSIAFLSLFMFIIGYINGKLIALQQIAIVQLTWLSLVTLKDPVYSFSALRQLKYSFGYNSIFNYDYSINVPSNIKAQNYFINPAMNYIFSLLFIILPMILTLIIKLISISKYKNKIKKLKPKRLFCENVFYGLMFCSYIIFSSFIVNLKLMIADINGNIIGIGIGAFFLIVCIVFIYLLYKLPQKYFGEFKSTFLKLEISSYFYCFLYIQRLVSSGIIIGLESITFVLFIEMAVIGFQLGFIVYKKPYNNGCNRPIINLIITQCILLLLSLSNVFNKSDQKIDFLMYFPIGITLLLILSLIINITYFVMELKRAIIQYCQDQDIKNRQNTENKDKLQIHTTKHKDDIQGQRQNEMSEEEDVNKKMDFQFNLFTQNFMMNSSMLDQTNHIKLQKHKINQQWQNYLKISTSYKNQQLVQGGHQPIDSQLQSYRLKSIKQSLLKLQNKNNDDKQHIQIYQRNDLFQMQDEI